VPTSSLLEPEPTSISPPQPSSNSPLSSDSPTLLSILSRADTTCLVHHERSSLPPICPCNQANGSDTKTHWTSKELQRALGCRRFRNYKHILQTSLNRKWIDGGEFLLALSSYATIPKANQGGTIDQAQSPFLDIVQINIAFGNCVSVGRFCYVLILVDRATCYNWVYGLKDLLGDSILLALCNFKANAGSYGRCFRSDCDTKLFEKRIQEHLINHNSNIVATVADCQSSNGLVEFQLKTKVLKRYAQAERVLTGDLE
jgi:hypothetical protein